MIAYLLLVFITSSCGALYIVDCNCTTSFAPALSKESRKRPAGAKSLAIRRGRKSTMRQVSNSSAYLSSSVFAALSLTLALIPKCAAQDASNNPPASAAQDAGTSTDLFIMLGSDFDRPGLLPKANYNIGIGHTFGFLKKDPLGDELTFAYTYEDAGSGFWHSQYGSDTESFGIMKNSACRRRSGSAVIRGFRGDSPV
jgi:hypothetical protein